MFKELVIRIGDENYLSFSSRVSVSVHFGEDTFYTLEVDLDEGQEFENVFTSENIESSLRDLAEFNDCDDVNCMYHIPYNILKEKLETGHLSDLYSSCDTIKISGDYDKVLDFIENSTIAKGKEIVLLDFLDVDYDSYLKVKEYFSGVPNMKFILSGNMDEVSFADYEKTVLTIKSIVDRIKTYDYSPLEQALYAYDLVRDRFYVRADEEERYSVSRDLTSALLGDKIVCLGFANIYNTILHMLGFNTRVSNIYLKKKPELGHARVFTYIRDDKYGVDGLYFFDPTFDCKKDDLNSYLTSYRFFARTKEQMDEYDRGAYTYDDYRVLDASEVYDWEEEHPETHLRITDLFGKIDMATINKTAKLLGREPISFSLEGISKEEILDILLDASDKVKKPIGAQVFLQALYNVRRNQYYENPEKYLFDMEALIDILVNSKILDDNSAVNSLLVAIFGNGYSVSEDKSREMVLEFIEKNDLKRDMESVRLTRLLRTILERKQQEEREKNKSKK